MTKLFIYSTKKETTQNGKKRSFIAFYTKMDILVKGEESKGLQTKSITCKFTKDVDTSKIKRGIIEVKDENINSPYVYEIKKDDEGKDIYPCVWIKKIENYTYKPFKPKDSGKFHLEEEDDEELKPIDFPSVDEINNMSEEELNKLFDTNEDEGNE